MGHDLSASVTNSEWSAAVVRTAPQDVQQVHERFLQAGADILTSATYQAPAARIPAAIELLGRALDQHGVRSAVVLRAASLGPLAATLGGGREYCGYADTSVFADGTDGARAAFRHFHEARLRQCLPFLEAARSGDHGTRNSLVPGIDFVLFETIPDLVEAETISTMLTQEPMFQNVPWAISLQCRLPSTTLEDTTALEPHLASGGRVSAVVDQLLSIGFGSTDESDDGNGPLFIGFNCCPPALVRPILESLQRCRHPLARQLIQPPSLLAPNRSFVATNVPRFFGWAVYPNSGEVWDPSSQRWARPAATALDPNQEPFWRHHVALWNTLGAAIVGGCCRVGPEAIRALAKVVLE
jgi:homocysteine S-methyltransferase